MVTVSLRLTLIGCSKNPLVSTVNGLAVRQVFHTICQRSLWRWIAAKRCFQTNPALTDISDATEALTATPPGRPGLFRAAVGTGFSPGPAPAGSDRPAPHQRCELTARRARLRRKNAVGRLRPWRRSLGRKGWHRQPFVATVCEPEAPEAGITCLHNLPCHPGSYCDFHAGSSGVADA